MSKRYALLAAMTLLAQAALAATSVTIVEEHRAHHHLHDPRLALDLIRSLSCFHLS